MAIGIYCQIQLGIGFKILWRQHQYYVEHVSTDLDSDSDPCSQMGTVPILGTDLCPYYIHFNQVHSRVPICIVFNENSILHTVQESVSRVCNPNPSSTIEISYNTIGNGPFTTVFDGHGDPLPSLFYLRTCYM